MEAQIVYHGWISAWFWQKRKLRKLGVRGAMRYNWKHACYENCSVLEDQVDVIGKKHRQFYPRVFTAVYDNGTMVRGAQQKLWRWQTNYNYEPLTLGLVKKHSGNRIALEVITKDYAMDGDATGFFLRIGKVYVQYLWEKP